MWPEPEHYSTSDNSESCGRRSQIIMRNPCMVSIRHIPRNLPDFIHERELPLAGFIFVCDGCALRYHCKRKFMCLPATNWRRRQIPIARVRPGTKLFFFQLEARLLLGVYETTTFPHISEVSPHETAFKVYFRVDKRHEPLEERVFKHAISEENSDKPSRFYGILSRDQVAALLALYRCQDYRQFSGPRYYDPLFRRPHITRQSQTAYNLAENSSIYSRGVLTGTLRGTYKSHSQTQFNGWTFDQLNAHITGANAIPLNPRKKNFPAKELLESDVKPKVANKLLIESGALHAQKFTAASEIENFCSSSRVLEDGEFVALTESIKSSPINEKYGKLHEPESDSMAIVHQTRNFIQMLEEKRTSVSNNESTFCNRSSPGHGVVKWVQRDDDEAESSSKERAVQNEASDTINDQIEESSRAMLIARRNTGKHPPASVFSANHGEKVRQSVWLRLTDPRSSFRSRHWYFGDEHVCQSDERSRANMQHIM